LCTALPLTAIYLYTKFDLNGNSSFKVICRTRYRTDRWTERQSDNYMLLPFAIETTGNKAMSTFKSIYFQSQRAHLNVFGYCKDNMLETIPGTNQYRAMSVKHSYSRKQLKHLMRSKLTADR